MVEGWSCGRLVQSVKLESPLQHHPLTVFSTPTQYSLQVEEVGVVVAIVHGAPSVRLLMIDQLPAVLALRYSSAMASMAHQYRGGT